MPSSVEMDRDSSRNAVGVYDVTGRIATDLAKHIRDQGYSAWAHTLRCEQLSMLPHAYAAGLGEMGKHGSIINKELGCSFRVSVVTTSLPLAIDAPRLEGIDDMCTNCRICVDYCPGDAISHEKQEVRGQLKWQVDTEACAPYIASYNACGICLQVCPANAGAFDGKFREKFIQTIKGIDPEESRRELKSGAQEPWTYVVQPAEFSEGWRMRVEPRVGRS